MHSLRNESRISKRSGCHNNLTQFPLENFTNPVIDTKTLPRFEEVHFDKLHRDYWKVTLFSIITTFLIFAIILAVIIYFIDEAQQVQVQVISAVVVIFIVCIAVSRISFLKKGYAFRTHDVLFRSGIIATNTTIIPYNRVQHVALHEGFYSRFFGLAEIQVFTAGGSSSDIHIPGIEKERAENIKQLLMGKIQKQL